jgi:phage terminase Nu1 subunit (DNA packaging protein)
MGKSRSPRAPSKLAKKKAAAEALPEVPQVVTAAYLAWFLSDPARDKPFTDRWLRELADKGYLVRAGRGHYDLRGSHHGYLRWVRETEVKPASDASNSREAFEAERARKLKLENDQAEALLIPTQLAIDAVDAVVGVYQSEVHSIPARVTQDVALRRQWEQEIDRVSDGIKKRCEKAVANLEAGRDPLDDAGEDDT